MNYRRPSLDDVFSPRGVAVVGASPTGRGFSTGVLMSLKSAGFPAIYAVNRKYNEVLGIPCYPRVRDIPGIVDYVVVGIPAESALELLDDCAAKGVRAVQFFTAGFRESGLTEGAELEQAMLEKARQGGFRIIGPNCIGLFVPKSRLVNANSGPMEPGPIAFMSQSGGHASFFPADGGPRGLRFSKVISYGNGLDIDDSELLHYFASDPETELIAAYIEGAKNGPEFKEALKEAASKKPVVIYKGGTTEAGLRAARGHTASLTSSVDVFKALCRQVGAIRVDDTDELLDMLVALRFATPWPKGTGVALVGAGGGPSVLASDEIDKAGLHMPVMSPETREKLLQFLPMAGSILANPIDAPTLSTPEAIGPTLRVLSQLPEINILIYHLGFHPIGSLGIGRFSSQDFLEPTIDAMKKVWQESGKPIVLALRPGLSVEAMKEFLVAQEAFVNAGFPVFHTLRQAAVVISRLVSWNNSHH
ncbi:MAG TPA: hypothetical protein G4O07_00940 [Dehalococcoidia bacterium]|nr:hypothetical protein [Dehalococcoidia bacterium]